MRPHFLFIATVSLLWAGCSPSIEPVTGNGTTPITVIPTPPPPVVDSTLPPPVRWAPIPPDTAAYSPTWLTEAQILSYNGARPVRTDGKAATVYKTDIFGGRQDTILFNKSLWSHRPYLRRHTAISDPTKGGINVTYEYRVGDDGEIFTIWVPNKVGYYKADTLANSNGLKPYFELVGSDYGIAGFPLDKTKSNWIRIRQSDWQAKTVWGEFSLHFKISRPKYIGSYGECSVKCVKL